MSISDEDALIGTTLPGGYVILELIGVGGMGRVYRAEQTALGRTVAVKIIHPTLLNDESASARFITEARTASLLNHPNSVAVIDFGRTDSGQLYLVMEYLRGRDLARVMYEDGLLGFERIIEILRQVLAALSEAHHLGIIHRDLKPENIVIEPMRTGGDFVKVVDFGLAKLLTTAQGRGITATGIVCGTPDYMAPEQGRGDPIDARSDLYAVGVILFQLLTGRLPFEADSPTQVVLMHLTVAPPDPRAIAPERSIPASLAMITLSALAKSPGDRYQDADAFGAALMAAKNQLDVSAGRVSQAPDQNFVQCPVCQAPVPKAQRFCGECGARISSSSKPVPAQAPVRPAPRAGPQKQAPSDKRVAARVEMPLVSRDEDLEWLLDRQGDGRSNLTAGRIVGTPGIGKTRLVSEFLNFVREEGDVVVQTEPDPWWSEVAYHSLRAAVTQLASLPPSGGSQRDWRLAGLEVQQGLSTIFGNKQAGLAPQERRHAVAEALRWAMSKAASANPGKRIVLFIDDLHRVDGASRNAFADALAQPLSVPILVLTAHLPGFDAKWPSIFPVKVLEGLDPEKAASLISITAASHGLRGLPSRSIPPMYVEQVIRYAQEGGTDPPQRLADLVALRIARLNADARRVLQAVAVLGQPVKLEHIAKLVEDGMDICKSIDELSTTGMVVVDEPGPRISHPLIREIAAATIPAGVRRELHAAVGNLAGTLNLPLEARALHALSAQDAFEALLLLDQVGDFALARDDFGGAVLAFRRGLDLARREIFRGELDDPMRAVLIFSRKLGDALTRAGDITDADGVLREALDLAAPAGEDRARVLFALANVAKARQRPHDAIRYLREAIDLAHRSGAAELLHSMEETGRAWAS